MIRRGEPLKVPVALEKLGRPRRPEVTGHRKVLMVLMIPRRITKQLGWSMVVGAVVGVRTRRQPLSRGRAAGEAVSCRGSEGWRYGPGVPQWRAEGLGLILWLAALAVARSALYHVAPDGSDDGPGSTDQPWRTISRAVSAAQPGDTVLVRSGVYPERVTTLRGGTDESSRIRFIAEGTVVMRGWNINHPYISVEGFDITGHTDPSSTEAYVRVNNGGSYFQLVSCRIRDGVALKREDVRFEAPNRITSATGGFLEAGFVPGNVLSVWRGTNIALSNRLSYTVATVSDKVITVVETNIVDDGPKPAYLTGSPNYGVLLASGTMGCLLRGNTFSNLSYRHLFVQGFNHRVEGNTFEHNNGWDLLFFSGTNHVIRSNLFRNLGWGVYEPSPDVFDNWPVRYENIQFEYNMVLNMIGVINAQKRNTSVSGPLYIRRNVFVDVGWLSLVMPLSVVEHNTFLRVAKRGNVAVQVERHPLIINAENYATNSVIRNNVFVDCGQATGQVSPLEVGWYRVIGPSDSLVAQGNFVAGGPPLYAAKVGWPEDPELNGGDPGFVNIEDPLGPDGLPFTEDDGLRLRPDSRLIGRGAGGATPGAYDAAPEALVQLTITRGTDPGRIRLSWPDAGANWVLEASERLEGPWWSVTNTVVSGDGVRMVDMEAADDSRFFRLRR
ncbi:MAG: hypothetical protein KatS3mg132_011 [Limisphaera sp.]|nr:MAG: hypothetical protein KatS3mg132_011 [Limisphaera sp.]